MSFLFKCCKHDNPQEQYHVDRRQGQLLKTQYVNNIKDIKDLSSTGRVFRVKRSQYDELIKQYRADKKWTDPTFPPGVKSLGYIQKVPNTCDWKRLSEIIEKPELFDQSIEPQDVVQGSLGDCYFLSALAALAQKPDRIKNVFGDQKYNPAGIYKVTLRVDGVIQQILIDDYVPVNQNNKPLFCQPRKGQIWVLLLEKAWAKANGSYANINSGTPSQVFKAVTYAPSQLRPIKNQPEHIEKLWQDILSNSQKNNPICCGTNTNSNINWNGIGLTQAHSYTLIDAANIQDEQGTVYRMLKLRNPWGFNQWMGRGNETDQQFWSKIPSNGLGPFQVRNSHRNDGLFFMEYGDFIQYFNQVHFCHLLQYPKYQVEPMHSDGKHGTVYTFNVSHQDDYIIQLHQEGLKAQDDIRRKQGLNRSTLVVARGDNYQFLDGSMKYQEQDNSLRIHLIPGKYYVYAKIDPSANQNLMPKTMSISSYSNHYVDIVPIPWENNKDFLNHVFLSYARSHRRKQFDNGLMWISWKLLFDKGGFAYLAFGVDPRSDKKFVITIDQNDFINLGFILKKPHKGLGKQTIQVRPGKQQVIVARVKNAHIQSMTFPPPMDIQIIKL